MDMVAILEEAVGLPKDITAINVPTHEDNAGALILAEILTSQYTSKSKHYAYKTIWFNEETVKRGIKSVKLNTIEQLGDMFTKVFPRFSLSILYQNNGLVILSMQICS